MNDIDVFFPIAAMLHFGDPDWYDRYVGPLRANYTQADKIQVRPIPFPLFPLPTTNILCEAEGQV